MQTQCKLRIYDTQLNVDDLLWIRWHIFAKGFPRRCACWCMTRWSWHINARWLSIESAFRQSTPNAGNGAKYLKRTMLTRLYETATSRRNQSYTYHNKNKNSSFMLQHFALGAMPAAGGQRRKWVFVSAFNAGISCWSARTFNHASAQHRHICLHLYNPHISHCAVCLLSHFHRWLLCEPPTALLHFRKWYARIEDTNETVRRARTSTRSHWIIIIHRASVKYYHFHCRVCILCVCVCLCLGIGNDNNNSSGSHARIPKILCVQ